MNFLDTHDLTGSSTPPQGIQPEQSINEEVNQVIGQLGRFWGGFRKQSQSAFETARRDLGDVVSQAQTQLNKFTGEGSKESSSSEEDTKSEAEDARQTETPSEADTPLATSISSHQDLSSSSLLSRLQSAFPPNIVTTVQNNIPETLKHATENIDLAQLRATLSNEFHRVQDATMAHAGEYVHKSEELFREAMKEAGEVLKDAVKVIPPDEVEIGTETTPGFIWDGSDIWMLPTPAGERFGKGKGRESTHHSGQPPRESQRAVATRAESLFKQLKHNPEIIKVDPESDDVVRELYTSWIRVEVDVKEGGIEGDEWSAKVSSVLSEPGDGQALQTSQDALVPSEMTRETFWKRYFFRVYQIGREEEKRKALLRGSIETEEDFSWEDEEEDTTSTTQRAPDSSERSLPDGSTQASLSAISDPLGEPGTLPPPLTPTHTSPRESSDESYDLLSSENDSTNEGKRRAEKKKDGDDPDSDWE